MSAIQKYLDNISWTMLFPVIFFSRKSTFEIYPLHSVLCRVIDVGSSYY